MLADAVRMLSRTGGQDSLSLLEACADEIVARRARVRQGKNRFDLSARDMAQVLAVDESTFHRYRTGFV